MSFFCCCCNMEEEVVEETTDRVRDAFNVMDINGDGYVTFSEFKKFIGNLDESEAKRLFLNCDQDGDRRLTLEELQTILGQ